jgi:hypothetical protein
MPISDLTRQDVRERANYLCEYCHSPERLSANRFTVDHIIPRSLEGSDDISNLALACRRCNERRYNFVAGVDPVTFTTSPKIFQHSAPVEFLYSGAMNKPISDIILSLLAQMSMILIPHPTFQIFSQLG